MLAADTVDVDGYAKGSVVLWNTSSGKLIATLNAPDGQAFGAPPAFSPDGSTLAAANADGSVYLWNTATGKPAGTLPDPTASRTVASRSARPPASSLPPTTTAPPSCGTRRKPASCRRSRTLTARESAASHSARTAARSPPAQYRQCLPVERRHRCPDGHPPRPERRVRPEHRLQPARWDPGSHVG